MRNLVWTFWLALILSIIGTFIASVFLMRQWNNFVSYSEMEGPNNFNFRFLAISREIENTLNKNGNLETLLLDHPITKRNFFVKKVSIFFFLSLQ